MVHHVQFVPAMKSTLPFETITPLEHLPSIEYYLEQLKSTNQIALFPYDPSFQLPKDKIHSRIRSNNERRLSKDKKSIQKVDYRNNVVKILPKSKSAIWENRESTSEIFKPWKRRWSQQEDAYLKKIVNRYNGKDWQSISNHLYDRSRKQCRDRYHTQLKDNINKSEWTLVEDALLLKTRSEIGNKWAILSTLLPGRTPTFIKNRYRSLRREMNNL